jgi:hypothetical protein
LAAPDETFMKERREKQHWKHAIAEPYVSGLAH